MIEAMVASCEKLMTTMGVCVSYTVGTLSWGSSLQVCDSMLKGHVPSVEVSRDNLLPSELRYLKEMLEMGCTGLEGA